MKRSSLLLIVILLLLFYSLLVYICTYANLHHDGSKEIAISFLKSKNDKDIKLFYIYDWKDEIIDRWPRSYSSNGRLGIEEKFKANFGIGNVIDDYIGLFDTHQYSLFRTFYFRLSESKYRTMDPSKASLFFIPYDVGMDCSININNGRLMPTNCPMMSTVLNLLQCNNTDDDHDDDENIKTCYFTRNSGNDHFMLLSLNQPMWHFIDHNNWQLYKACYNCSKLAIDVYPPKLFRVLQQNDFLTNKWYSIPFPSSFHNNKNASGLLWHRNNIIRSNRQYPLSFLGSLKVTSKVNKKLRESLINECSKRPSTCLLNRLNSHDSQALTGLVQEGLPYAKSVFCLMPGGDFPTRKGVFDAMLSGCIPVVFNLYTFHYQNTFHYQLETATDCSVLVDQQLINNISATFDTLVAMSRDVDFIEQKLRCIANLSPRVQYNLPFNGVKENDAVDIILERLLSKS